MLSLHACNSRRHGAGHNFVDNYDTRSAIKWGMAAQSYVQGCCNCTSCRILEADLKACALFMTIS